MGDVIYSLTASLDGYVADRNGAIEWSEPDEELHQFHNDRVRGQGAELLGRRLYETMAFWHTDEAVEGGPIMREFAELWRALPKVVFSSTLDRVEGENVRLATCSLAEEIAVLKEEVDGHIGIGGATLAASAIEAGLVDDYQLFVAPVILGGGTPVFPPLADRIGLELVETRTFGGGVTFLRYRADVS